MQATRKSLLTQAAEKLKKTPLKRIPGGLIYGDAVVVAVDRPRRGQIACTKAAISYALNNDKNLVVYVKNQEKFRVFRISEMRGNFEENDMGRISFDYSLGKEVV